MTALAEATDNPSGTAATPPRVRLKLVGGAIAVVAVLTAVTMLAWTWRHPTAFPEVPPAVSTSSDRWPVGQALFVGMTYPLVRGESAVTLHGAEANVVTNTADATVTFGICTLRPQARSSIGSVRAPDISQYCETWVSIDDQRLTSDTEPFQQLLMKVTPRQRGTVEVAGAAVFYSHGWQRGTQDIGEHLRLRVSE